MDPNGIFDIATENAVKTFQQVFFLDETGIVDKSTWYKIKRIFVGVRRLSELDSIGITKEEASLPYSSELSVGNSGDEVRVIQYYLNVIAYFNQNLNNFAIDGIYGEDTANAVRVFQDFYSLAPTGTVDRPTWEKIREIYDDIRNNLPEGYSGNKAKLYPGYVLSEGMRGENVRDLQTYLARISSFIPELPTISVDGIYGPETANAVRIFQRLYKIPVSGSVGPVTWFNIAREYDLSYE
jgi:peptidoglycan hydrolase-like protein with peptidoglycan-binding domain